MGVATNKKVKADLVIGTGTDKQVIDIDDKSIIGTQEGVAYITAKYTTNDKKTYTSSSMKIVVTPQGATEETTDGKTYMVTASSSLRVRSGAGTNFSQIGSLKNGATVKVESIANGWAKLENGGYVSAQYLAEVVDNGEAQTMYVTARTLNVRKGPGTSYAKAGTPLPRHRCAGGRLLRQLGEAEQRLLRLHELSGQVSQAHTLPDEPGSRL